MGWVTMYMRILHVVFFALLLVGCTRSSVTSHTALLPILAHSSQQNRPLPVFTRVRIDGRINVNLRTGYRKSYLVLRGAPDDLAAVTTRMEGGTLRIEVGKGYPHHGAVQADLYTQYLRSFEYHGIGLVTGTGLGAGLSEVVIDNEGRTSLQGRLHLNRLVVSGDGSIDVSGVNSQDLYLKINGKTNVKLAGMANVSSIEMGSHSSLSLYWVNSTVLRIRAHDKAAIQLAGIVDKLDVELWDCARFNGRYLRAVRAFVKTHGDSVAEMSAVLRQHTLASDNSDIRFYNIPQMKADFMAFNGAVLDMRNLAPPYIQEYNEYNK